MGTRESRLFFASSGTGMMEASLVNILAPGERVLMCAAGSSANDSSRSRARWAPKWIRWISRGDAPSIRRGERRVAAADYRAVVVVHNESSTGVVADLAAIGAVLRDTPALLIVDSVSGLGGMEMRQDEWGDRHPGFLLAEMPDVPARNRGWSAIEQEGSGDGGARRAECRDFTGIFARRLRPAGKFGDAVHASGFADGGTARGAGNDPRRGTAAGAGRGTGDYRRRCGRGARRWG